MADETAEVNVRPAVPFFAVSNMEKAKATRTCPRTPCSTSDSV